MGTGYIRKDTGNNIADGNVINASDLDGEFDGLVSAFATSTGHSHDGTEGEGGPVSKIGPSLQYEADATALFPETNNAVDLGKTAKQFKDLYIDGVINADNMSADTATMISATITNNASVGGTFIVAGTATLSSTVDITGAASVASTLTVTNESKLQNVSATGTLNVDNNTTLGGNFSVSATATFSNNIIANGDLVVASGLEVGAISTFSAKTTFTTDATVGGTFAVGGTTNLATANITGTVNVTGETTLDDVSASGTLDVAGTTNLATAAITGTLAVSGNASVGGTHTVDGDLKNTSGNLTVDPATQIFEIKGSGSTEGQVQLNCAVNTHGQKITAADHSLNATNTLTLPGGDTIGNSDATLVSDTGTQTLTNKTFDDVTLGTGTADISTMVSQVAFQNNLRERTSINTTSATGTINFDILSHNVELRTSDAAANWELNFRGNSGTPFASTVGVGQTTSFAFESSQGGTAYYLTAIEIDGTTASPVYWQGGTAPSEGNVSGVDSYLINITRRADGGSGTAQYTVLASQTQFGKVDY